MGEEPWMGWVSVLNPRAGRGEWGLWGFLKYLGDGEVMVWGGWREVGWGYSNVVFIALVLHSLMPQTLELKH